jgi:hypothetical protein
VGELRLTRFILHAIAVLGVNPKPLRGRLAMACAEYIPRRRAMARRGLTPPLGDGVGATKSFADNTGLLRPVLSAKPLVANNAAPDERSHPEGRSAAEDPP